MSEYNNEPRYEGYPHLTQGDVVQALGASVLLRDLTPDELIYADGRRIVEESPHGD